ncbi:universal stress protein [Haloplanus aerogenes]|uniref:Nucleotide-binding universal stress UspA family protein n=1 Tax=Haloplanus aerogenes TaxID=660522 RepID=A0A3M0D9Z2_9EURY|nr:universal stress protein [Haloplanus aerogenes]AZH26107.1 universal stress protein [Haloplanus aerogenes]RMB18442.1 nucleotide-binding universal stress UspA family protein [Haloplanus aerogenes]
MYDAILVPTDGSEGVDRTLEHALEMARNHDATIHALYVVDRRFELAADEDREDLIEQLTERGEEAVASIADAAGDAGVDVVTSVREGIPYKTILGYAEEADIDVITMGTHGRTGRDRLAHLGSVTDRVVENATVPVFVVNIGTDE